MIDGYLSHLDLFRKDESPVSVIMVVSESEFTRLCIAIDLLQVTPELCGKFVFKIIKVAGVSFKDPNQVNSFDTYKELLAKSSLTDDISEGKLCIIFDYFK